MGIDSLPTRGSQSGNTNVTIHELKTKTDLQTFLSENKVVQSNETLEVSLDNYASFPDAPDFSESTTDLSNRDDLSGLDSIVLYQDYEKATIAIRADKKGIKIFDTSFLGINPDYTYDKDIFTYRFWQYLGTETSNTWWQTEEIGSSNYLDNIYDRLEIEPNAIYLSPETYFDSDGESYYFKVIRVQERLPVEERQEVFSLVKKKLFLAPKTLEKSNYGGKMMMILGRVIL
jgi:hypothetical protein